MHRLGTDAVRYYEDNGYYLFKEPVFSPERFASLQDWFERILKADNPNRTDELDVPHFYYPELLSFLLDDTVLDIVEPLLGPDVGLWTSHFISKEPFIGRATPWHEDSAYWAGRFDQFSGIATIWLALDKADAENGAMKVIPGTHTFEASDSYEAVDTSKNTFDKQIADVDESKAVVFELEPNECSLHDSRIIHGADANTSSRRRCGYTMRYFSQQMKLNRDHPANKDFKLWHARGKNPHNNPVVN